MATHLYLRVLIIRGEDRLLLGRRIFTDESSVIVADLSPKPARAGRNRCLLGLAPRASAVCAVQRGTDMPGVLDCLQRAALTRLQIRSGWNPGAIGFWLSVPPLFRFHLPVRVRVQLIGHARNNM